jgi:hypothetical protein
MGRSIAAIAAAWVWVGFSEFLRNQLLFAQLWVDHYRSLGLEFPNAPLNAALWMLWALVFVIVVWVLSRRFALVPTMILAWVIGFVLMWLVIGNLGVLPFGLLWFAVPLSMIEAAGAAVLVAKIDPRS